MTSCNQNVPNSLDISANADQSMEKSGLFSQLQVYGEQREILIVVSLILFKCVLVGGAGLRSVRCPIYLPAYATAENRWWHWGCTGIS